MTTFESFAGRLVLITGGAGLVGSHLADALLARGANVTVVDNLCSGRKENLDLAHPGLCFEQLDVGEGAQSKADSPLDKLVAAADFVYHLASPIGVARAHNAAFDTTGRILRDGLNVAEACLRRGKPVLYTSSSEIYGNAGEHRLGEDETAGFGQQPRWGYGAAKMAVEHLFAGLWREHRISAWNVRFFNIVGPRQNPASGLVVSAFCQAALDGRPLQVHGDGSDRRTFLHVADAVEALLAIPASDSLRGRAVNVGGTENISIRELAELVVRLHGSGRITHVPHEKVYGPHFVAVSDRRPRLDLVMQATGWRPRRTLEEAIVACFDSMARERTGAV
jgi:UDP-glucose 4-epimerase